MTLKYKSPLLYLSSIGQSFRLYDDLKIDAIKGLFLIKIGRASCRERV